MYVCIHKCLNWFAPGLTVHLICCRTPAQDKCAQCSAQPIQRQSTKRRACVGPPLHLITFPPARSCLELAMLRRLGALLPRCAAAAHSCAAETATCSSSAAASQSGLRNAWQGPASYHSSSSTWHGGHSSDEDENVQKYDGAACL